jgi:peptidoglycan/xylan/chitin deacetylase (PgdA/CDA1 family)
MTRLLPGRRPVVLMYHGFCEEPRAGDDLNLFVTVEALAAQLELLGRRGWQPIDLDSYLETARGGRAVRPGSYLVTIDDGYRSVLDLGWPAFDAAAVRPVLFVPPAMVGRSSAWMHESLGEDLLDWDSLLELQDRGVELGVHGLDHQVLRGRGSDELRRQVFDARDVLEEHTGRRPRAFAYPEGVWDDAARSAVVDAGYEVAFTVHEGFDRWTVPRLDVTARDTPTSFRLKLAPGYRAWWRAAGHLGGLRPLVHRMAERRGRRSR